MATKPIEMTAAGVRAAFDAQEKIRVQRMDAATGMPDQKATIPQSPLVPVPTFADAAEAVKSGTYTALERFVYEYEPAGFTDEGFRLRLSAILSEAIANADHQKITSTEPEAFEVNKDPLTMTNYERCYFFLGLGRKSGDPVSAAGFSQAAASFALAAAMECRP